MRTHRSTTPPSAAASFREALRRLEGLARAFAADTLHLERLVLCARDGTGGPAGSTFTGPEAAPDRQEAWRVAFLLLDIAYGEPTSAVERIATDLTREQGALRPARDLALRIGTPGCEGPLRGAATAAAADALTRYGREVLRPNLAKCRALWRGPSAGAAPEVRAVLERGRDRLDFLEDAFRAAEHAVSQLSTEGRAAGV